MKPLQHHGARDGYQDESNSQERAIDYPRDRDHQQRNDRGKEERYEGEPQFHE